MRSGPALRLTAIVVAALAFGGLSCSSGDEAERSTKTTGSTGTTESTGSTDTSGGSTGSTGSSGASSGQTTIVGTGCELAPATTMMGESSGGHIVCQDTDDGQRPPFPPDTAVPSPEEGGGVIAGTLAEEGTGAALPGVVVLSEPAIGVATGADGRFGVAVEPGTYHLRAVVNRDVSYICSTPTVEVTAGNAASVAMTCRH
jgi:hypothetical protein